MGQIIVADLTKLDFANVNDLQAALDIIKNELNGFLDNTNVQTGADIDPGKIAGGGAVVQSEVTLVGAASKIPKLDASGDLLITSKLVFKTGLI